MRVLRHSSFVAGGSDMEVTKGPSSTVAEPVQRCVTCGGLIEFLDPTGDGLASWWAHAEHPEDGHDAYPAACVKDRGGLWRGCCPSCDWTSHLLTKTKANTARRQHRVDVHLHEKGS